MPPCLIRRNPSAAMSGAASRATPAGRRPARLRAAGMTVAADAGAATVQAARPDALAMGQPCGAAPMARLIPAGA